MTVASEVSSVSYMGNGSTKTFPVPFVFYAAADLVPVLVSTSGEATAGAFTAAGVGNLAGGAITLTSAPPSGVQLRIDRDPPKTQITAYTDRGRFPASSHERALDRNVMLTQAADGKRVRSEARSLRFKLGLNSSIPELDQNTYANKSLAFDGSGTPIADITASAAQVIVEGKLADVRGSDGKVAPGSVMPNSFGFPLAIGDVAVSAELGKKLNLLDVEDGARKRFNSPYAGRFLNQVPLDASYSRIVGVPWERPSGEISILCSRGQTHHHNIDRTLTYVTTRDRGATWTPEQVLIEPQGYDWYADVNCNMEDGSMMLVHMRRFDLVPAVVGPPAVAAYYPYGMPKWLRFDPVTLAFTSGDFTYDPSAGVTPMTNTSTMFPYGPILDWKYGTPGSKVVYFYGLGIFRSVFDGASQTWGPIFKIMNAVGGGRQIGEATIGELPDGRAYMVLGEAVLSPYKAWLSISQDGRTWPAPWPFTKDKTFTGEAFAGGRVPFYVYQYKSNEHFLIGRSASGVAYVDANKRGLCAKRIDPYQLIESAGVAGVGDEWEVIANTPDWGHGMGGEIVSRYGAGMLGVITFGEVPLTTPDGVTNGNYQGSGNSMALWTDTPAPIMSAQSVAAMLPPDRVNHNGDLGVWQLGTARRTTGATGRITGPDGFSVNRGSNVVGGFVEGVDDGEQTAMRIGRVEGDASVETINWIWAISGEAARRLAGKYICVQAILRAGANFSAAGGVVNLQMLSGNVAGKMITASSGAWATNGSDPEAFAMNQAAIQFKALTTGYGQSNRAFAVPHDCKTLLCRMWYTPTGIAGANDWVQFRRLEGIVGYLPTFQRKERFEDARRRCQEIVQKSYPYAVALGNTTVDGLEFQRCDFAAVNGTSIRVPFKGTMAGTPQQIVSISPTTGARGKYNNFTTAADGSASVTYASADRFTLSHLDIPTVGDRLGFRWAAQYSLWTQAPL